VVDVQTLDTRNPDAERELLALLPVFSFSQEGQRLALSPLLERVLCRLAVAHPVWVSRDAVIEDCELADANDPRARLRQICWIIRTRVGFELIVGDRRRLGIAPSCRVDFHAAQQWCRWVMERQFEQDAIRAVPDWVIRAANQPLLSDWAWEDSWLHPAQAEWDVLRREVLSGLSKGLLELGKHDQALLCAHGLIQQDPMRESAWEVLIAALLRSGRRAEARAQFERLSKLLCAELGVRPSPAAHRLIEHLYQTQRL
jgi:DNA-binding SARP family transcriptional activator